MAAKNMDFETAHSLLEQAERMDATSVRVLKARGAVFLAESRVGEARGYFDRALTLAPRDAKVLSGRGMCDVLSGELSSAMKYFMQALESSPEHLVALHQLVDCSYRLNTFDDLHMALNRYLAVKPEDAEMRFCLAGCLFKMGMRPQASEQVDRILAQDPNHSAALQLKEQLSSRAAPTVAAAEQPKETPVQRPILSGGSLQASLEELSKRMTEWRVNGQQQEKETAVVVQPQTELPPINIMRSETANGAPAPSVGQVSAPSNPQNDMLESRLYDIEELKREKDYESAKTKLEALLSGSNLQGDIRAQAKSIEAELMIVEGDLVGADMLYDLILEETPEYPRALAGKGALAADGERWSEAQQYFERALKKDPNYDVALAGKALCEMNAGNNEAAFELFRRAAQQNPENSRAILGVLQVGYPLKKFADIETTLRSYLDIHPASIDMLYSLAGVLFAQRRMSEARGELDKILIFEPGNPRATELKRMIEDSNASPRAF
jgi:tetratricopeptide (TPR) repeat protein